MLNKLHAVCYKQSISANAAIVWVQQQKSQICCFFLTVDVQILIDIKKSIQIRKRNRKDKNKNKAVTQQATKDIEVKFCYIHMCSSTAADIFYNTKVSELNSWGRQKSVTWHLKQFSYSLINNLFFLFYFVDVLPKKENLAYKSKNPIEKLNFKKKKRKKFFLKGLLTCNKLIGWKNDESAAQNLTFLLINDNRKKNRKQDDHLQMFRSHAI